MTQKEKLKLECKNKLKKFFIKTLNIISYILSIGFIAVLIISGCQSCKKTEGVSAESINPSNYTYTYSFKFTPPFTIDNTYVLTMFDMPTGQVQTPVGTQEFFTGIIFDDLITGFDVSTNNSYYIKSLDGSFVVVTEEDGFNYWRLNGCYYRDENSDYLTNLFYLSGSSTDTWHYNLNSNIQLLLSYRIYGNDFFNYFFTFNESSNFIFNPQINYNSYLGTNILGAYGSNSFDQSSGAIRFKTFDVGLFISNGQIFDKIVYNVVESDGVYVLGRNASGSDGVIQAQSGYFVYTYLMYLNSFNNQSVIVNKHDQRPFQPSVISDGFYYVNSSTWTNDNYRKITFLQNLSITNKNYIEGFNNNNQNSFSGNIYVEGGDVFTLLGTCFSSLGDFFGLAILPGISIGVLFFLPLIVGIIVIMFHILKK